MDFYEMVHKAYRQLNTCLFRPNGGRCRACGTALGTTYLEERLYAVRCEKCNTVTLVKARCPADAEAAVGNFDGEENS